MASALHGAVALDECRSHDGWMGDSGFQMGEDTIPDRYNVHMWRFMEPHVDSLVNAAALSPDDAVLDVACGTGFVARTAVERGCGRVVGADINPAMLATARGSSEGITWVEASALDMPFEDREFDVAICSQGVQFFPDPAAGLAEMSRVAERLVVTIWPSRSEVPWFDAHIPMLTTVCGVDLTLMEMSFSREDEVRDWFAAAGLRPEVVRMETYATLPGDFSAAYLSALPWGQPFFTLDIDEREAALAQVSEQLAAYATTANEITIPFKSFLVTASSD
jgi:SAM-dependent methyltransferase